LKPGSAERKPRFSRQEATPSPPAIKGPEKGLRHCSLVFGGFSPVKMKRKRFSLALAAAYFIPRSTHRLKQRLERV
jgi:hypothetical protein